jgi:23S rRNA A2030 N6-methylase RlmJ
MANRHFGKLADVWKHAVLLEILQREPPAGYAETHAGSGAYPLVADGERRFGILKFLDVAADFSGLAQSPYRAAVTPYLQAEPAVYPGSALLAMSVLGNRSSYLLCDLDPASATDLRQQAAGLSLRHCQVVQSDGMAATAAWLDSQAGSTAPGSAVVHIDPFDPYAHSPGGQSALQFAASAAGWGARLAYWYGYDQPAQRAWAYHELAALTRTPLWYGDVLVAGQRGASHAGDLGRATTPGTGFGMVLANVSAGTVEACAQFGRALANAYTPATLPDGTPGSVVFTSLESHS